MPTCLDCGQEFKYRGAVTLRCYRCAQIRQRTHSSVHRQVHWAIYRGDIVRKPCAICGATKSVAHHEDYAKPLEVQWLCATHHGRRHEEIRRALSQPEV